MRNSRYFGELIRILGFGEPLYTLLYAIGIIFFAYFYVSIVFNPNEVADNMRKYGGFIPGIVLASALPTISTRFLRGLLWWARCT